MSKARDYVFSRCFRGPHLITLALMGVLSLVGCQDSSSRTGSNPAGSEGGFVDGSSTQKSSGDVVDGGTQTTYYDHSESFVAQALKVKTLGKPLHMLWLVDTTGKYHEDRLRVFKVLRPDLRPGYDASGKNMADEIAAINKHLPLLIKNLKELSPVQVTLMFDPDGDRIEKEVSTSINRGVMESSGVHIVEDSAMTTYAMSFHSKPMYYLASYDDNGLVNTDCSVYPNRNIRCHPSKDFFRDPKSLKVIVGVRDRGIASGNKNYFNSEGVLMVRQAN